MSFSRVGRQRQRPRLCAGAPPEVQAKQLPGGEGSGEVPARPRHVPFEQMTRFVTKGGIGLHYLPGPLDKWACREVVDRAGEWHDNQAGRPLNEAEKGEYAQYREARSKKPNGEGS